MRSAQHGEGEQTLASWELANGQQLRLRVVQYKRQRFLDLRRWFRADDGEWRPTVKGVRVNEEMAPVLAELLARVADGDIDGAEGQRTQQVRRSVRSTAPIGMAD